MTETPKKYYDLEDKTYQFAKDVRAFTKSLIKNIENNEEAKQLVRASGSVAANYIEANESISKKDFIYRIKICRKESKESSLFIRLVDTAKVNEIGKELIRLVNEALELVKIFNSIAEKSEKGIKSEI